jgi:hypothetical protein
MVLQFACAKAGLILYQLEPESNTDALSAALHSTQANVLVVPETHQDTNYIRLTQQVLPETRIFDFASGMPFVSAQFPHLRLPIHTGFDSKEHAGFLPLRQFVVPTSAPLPPLDIESTPLAGLLSTKQLLTHSQVMEQNIWPTYKNILEKKYHTVEGVGVVF